MSSPDDKGQSGYEKGKENVRKLRNYIDQLKARKECLPMYRGGPNKSAIADLLGFNYRIWRDNPTARAILNEAAQDTALTGVGDLNAVIDADGAPNKGVEESELRESISRDNNGTVLCEKAAHLQGELDKAKRRIQKLEERDVVKSATIQELRDRIKAFSHLEEVMTRSGRRYIP